MRDDTGQSCRSDYKGFKVMSTTNALTSKFWEPSFTLGDCRLDMTDCEDYNMQIHFESPKIWTKEYAIKGIYTVQIYST